MNARDRMMAVLHHEEPDIIPFAVSFRNYLWAYGLSEAHRKLMNMGLGVFLHLSVQAYKYTSPHVKREVTQDYGNAGTWSTVDLWDTVRCGILGAGPNCTRTILTTPVGSISTTALGGSGRAGFTFIPDGGNLIKDIHDYEVLEYIIEDTEYSPNYEEVLKVQSALGNDGVVSVHVPKSPLQEILQMTGVRQFARDFFMHRKEVEELYTLIYRKELELFKIVAESPAEIVFQCDDLTGDVTNPELFEKYCIPFYNEAAKIFHRNDRIYAVHMCGRLRSLRDLIPKTSIDIIDAFTPPPNGDLPLREAKEAWEGKQIIWASFPASVVLEGQDAVEKKTIEILKSAAPGDDFLLQVAEDIPLANAPEALATILRTVMKHGVYPIPKD